MRNAIGFLIILWGLTQVFNNSVTALDAAASATFNTLEAAANASQIKIEAQ